MIEKATNNGVVRLNCHSFFLSVLIFQVYPQTVGLLLKLRTRKKLGIEQVVLVVSGKSFPDVEKPR